MASVAFSKLALLGGVSYGNEFELNLKNSNWCIQNNDLKIELSIIFPTGL